MPKSKKKYSPHMAVFHAHINNAHNRAMDFFKVNNYKYAIEIERVMEYEGNIMDVFKKTPSNAVIAYVTLVAYIVNHGEDEEDQNDSLDERE